MEKEAALSGPKGNPINAYISGFPAATRKLLVRMRKAIRAAAPDAEERISYGMPAFAHEGMLVYYAGFAKHIGFYPGAAAMRKFGPEFTGLKQAVGSVQFPLDKPLPLDMVAAIVAFRIRENAERAKAKVTKATKLKTKARSKAKANTTKANKTKAT
jgi:uncharacterized protein YdhG (YjbR/CyaY superfamily)